MCIDEGRLEFWNVARTAAGDDIRDRDSRGRVGGIVSMGFHSLPLFASGHFFCVPIAAGNHSKWPAAGSLFFCAASCRQFVGCLSFQKSFA